MRIFPLFVECLRVEPSVCILQSFFRARYTCMSTAESRIAARVMAWLGPKTGPQPRTQRTRRTLLCALLWVPALCAVCFAFALSCWEPPGRIRCQPSPANPSGTHWPPRAPRNPVRDNSCYRKVRSSDCAFCAFSMLWACCVAGLASQALMALTAGARVNDVILSGTATRIAGSNHGTGTVVIKGLGTEQSRVDLVLASSQRSAMGGVLPFVQTPNSQLRKLTARTAMPEPKMIPANRRLLPPSP